MTDSAGRAVPVPAQVTRVFPAGPPAAITLYTVAPDLLIGWPRANRADEREFLHPEIGARPEVGRITGRGNTANLEVVLALKPDLILDIGIVNNTYISLADRVQQQTGIPYALLDGRFDGIAETYRIIGALTGRRDAGEAAARYAEETVKTITGRLPPSRRSARASITRAGRAGSRPGSAARSMSRRSSCWRATSPAARAAASPRCRSRTCWCGIRRSSSPSTRISRRTSTACRPGGRSRRCRRKRVHLSPKLPFGWVDFPPSVNRLIGLWWLAKILYPELFPEDLRTLTRDFYQRFYHVALSDAQIDRVLAGRD